MPLLIEIWLSKQPSDTVRLSLKVWNFGSHETASESAGKFGIRWPWHADTVRQDDDIADYGENQETLLCLVVQMPNT